MEFVDAKVSASVGTEDFKIKFEKTVDELNASLSKSQRALRLVYDESGRLDNAFGKCVEGLTRAQIKLGEWGDELGRKSGKVSFDRKKTARPTTNVSESPRRQETGAASAIPERDGATGRGRCGTISERDFNPRSAEPNVPSRRALRARRFASVV